MVYLACLYKKSSSGSSFCKYRILIAQHNNSLVLLQAICKYLGVGKVYHSTKSVSTYKIFSLDDINKFTLKFGE
jgi:hypothetical protein